MPRARRNPTPRLPGTGLILGLALALPAAGHAQPRAPEGVVEGLGELAESVVLAVGERVVTRTELEFEARLVLVASGGVNAAFAELDAQTIASVQAYLINQLLILQEVERLGVFEVEPDEVSRELELLRQRFPSRQSFEVFLQSQDVSLDRVRAILERNLRVKRYLDTRVKMSVNVTDVDVRAFYEQEPTRFRGQPLERVREVIRGYLFEQRYKDAVQALMERLRKHGEVQQLETPARFAAVERPPEAASEDGVEDPG
ncbi:MAG: hypothetical protein P1V51_06530 [Deltaproteobacteria bacterium]|nr:hypothetical protein [Deltaproteobacteria bacterium]